MLFFTQNCQKWPKYLKIAIFHNNFMILGVIGLKRMLPHAKFWAKINHISMGNNNANGLYAFF